MSATILTLSPTAYLALSGAQNDAIIQIQLTDIEGSTILDKFNKVNAYFIFDGYQTKHLPLIFNNGYSQEIYLKQLVQSTFLKVGVFIDLEDDTTDDGDLYEHVVTNTVMLSIDGKTLADYGIIDAYTKDEIDVMIGDIESLLDQV